MPCYRAVRGILQSCRLLLQRLLEQLARNPAEAARHLTKASEVQRRDPRAGLALIDFYLGRREPAQALEAGGPAKKGNMYKVDFEKVDRIIERLDASLRKDTVTVVRGLDYYTAGAQPPGGTASPLIYRDRKLPAATFFSLVDVLIRTGLHYVVGA